MNPSTFAVHHIFTHDGCVLLCGPDETISISPSKTKSGTSFANRPVERERVTGNPDAHQITIADIPLEPGNGVEFSQGGVRRQPVRVTLTRSEIASIEQMLDNDRQRIADIIQDGHDETDEKNDYSKDLLELTELRRKLTVACGGKA